MYLSYGKINSPYNLLERRFFNLFLKALAGELVEVFLLLHSSSDAAFATSLLQRLLCSQKSWSEPRFTETQKPVLMQKCSFPLTAQTGVFLATRSPRHTCRELSCLHAVFRSLKLSLLCETSRRLVEVKGTGTVFLGSRPISFKNVTRAGLCTPYLKRDAIRVAHLQLWREIAIHNILQALLKWNKSSWSYLRFSHYLMTNIYILGCSCLCCYCCAKCLRLWPRLFIS